MRRPRRWRRPASCLRHNEPGDGQPSQCTAIRHGSAGRWPVGVLDDGTAPPIMALMRASPDASMMLAWVRETRPSTGRAACSRPVRRAAIAVVVVAIPMIPIAMAVMVTLVAMAARAVVPRRRQTGGQDKRGSRSQQHRTQLHRITSLRVGSWRTYARPCAGCITGGRAIPRAGTPRTPAASAAGARAPGNRCGIRRTAPASRPGR